MRLGTTVAGRYRLLAGPLRGGTGEVWLARDERLPRDVVLKRLLGGGTGRAGYERLRREARVLARLNHPHVVTLHDTERLGRWRWASLWLVMEYVPGGSLDGRPPLAPRLAAHLGAQIADALVALHTQGIVHGDLTPGNVVVTRDGTAKLADFGAAYRIDGETGLPGAALGHTPEYAAPEVARGVPSASSDVYSLGATVYALVAGRPPRGGAYRSVGGADFPVRGSGPGQDLGSVLGHGESDGGVGSGCGPGCPVRDGGVGSGPGHGGRDGGVGGAAGPLRREPDTDAGVLDGVLAAMLREDPAVRPTAAEVKELLTAASGPPERLPLLPDKDPGRAVTRPDGAAPYRRRALWPSLLGGGSGGPIRLVRPHRPRDPDHPHDPSRAGSPHRKRRVVAAATSAAALALALVAGILLARDSTEGPPAPSTAGPVTTGRQSTARPPVAPPSSLIGDHRTVDPCALAEPAALGEYGETELDAAYGNFNRCDVIVRTRGGTTVDVEIAFTADPPPESAGPPDSPGSAGPAGSAANRASRVSVVEEPAESGDCTRTLVPAGADDVTVLVRAKPADDSRPSPDLLCRIADTATHSAVRVIDAVPAGGELARRSPPLPAASLGKLDACSLLSPHALEAIPGVDAADPDVGFGNWACSWASTTSDLWLKLRFDRGEPPGAETGTPTRLGGHLAFLLGPDPDDESERSVTIVHRTYAGRHGQRLAETLLLTVGGSASPALVADLATAVATALPRA